LNQNRALGFCFDAFSSREPAATSLENAMSRPNSGHIGRFRRDFAIFRAAAAAMLPAGAAKSVGSQVIRLPSKELGHDTVARCSRL
jgi:hypothetical protein